MPETLNAPETLQVPKNLQVLETMLSDQAVASRREWLDNRLAGQDDIVYGHVKKSVDIADGLRESSIRMQEEGDFSGGEELRQKAESRMQQTEKTFGLAAIREVHLVEQAKYQLEKTDGRRLNYWGSEASRVFNKVSDETRLSGNNRVIFELGENTSRAEIKSHLANQEFIDYRTLHGARSNEKHLALHLSREEQVTIPVDNIVSAGSFENWAGRRSDAGDGEDDKDFTDSNGVHKIGRSIDAIIDYAKRDTDIPPLEGADAYVQPNGMVIYSVPNSNHRAAAAKLKGDKTIALNGYLNVYQLSKNFYELSENETAAELDNEQATTANGHEIDNPREELDLDELHDMLESYGLDGGSAKERIIGLKKQSKESIALFMTDLNARLNGSSESLVSEKTVKIGEKSTIDPADRFNLFTSVIDEIQSADSDVNPARLGDTLALSTVLLHPFKDGNGRTARVLAYIFRDDFTAEDAQEDFAVLIKSRDEARADGGFIIYGYVPYMGEGVDQSDPAAVQKYIETLLTEDRDDLYTGPFGVASLKNKTKTN